MSREQGGFGAGALIGVAVLALMAGCFLGFGLSLLVRPFNGVATPTQSSTGVAQVSPTQADELQPTTTQFIPPTVTQVSAESSAKIPGLGFVNVADIFVQQGFNCSPYLLNDAQLYQGTCTRDESFGFILIEGFGRTPDTLDFIDGNVNQTSEPSDEVSTVYLSLVATLPYAGAVPSDARQWVESTLPTITGDRGSEQTQIFSGVLFRLYGAPTARTLELGETVFPN